MKLLDRLVPVSALRWGRLTTQSLGWWADMVIIYGDHTAPPPAPLSGMLFSRNLFADLEDDE